MTTRILLSATLFSCSLMAADPGISALAPGTAEATVSPATIGNTTIKGANGDTTMKAYNEELTSQMSQLSTDWAHLMGGTDKFGGASSLQEKAMVFAGGEEIKERRLSTVEGVDISAPPQQALSPIFSDISFPGAKSGGGVPGASRERMYYHSYRDPATIKNPTLASMQKGLNAIHHAGQDAARRINSFKDKVQRSNNIFAKSLSCGGFDWAASFSFLVDLEAMKEYFLDMGEKIVAAAPMALLGAFSPQLAELIKHINLNLNFQTMNGKADCSVIQGAMTSGLQKAAWGDSFTDCLDKNKNLGVAEANRLCSDMRNQTVKDSLGKDKPMEGSNLGQSLANAYRIAGDWTDRTITNAGDYVDNTDTTSSNYNAIQGPAQAQAAKEAEEKAADTAPGTGMAGWMKSTQSWWNNAKQFHNGNGDSLASQIWGQTIGQVQFAGSASMELGPNRMEGAINSFSSASDRGSDLMVAALLDHYDLLTGVKTVDSTVEKRPISLTRSYQIVNAQTYFTRRLFDLSGTQRNGFEEYAATVRQRILGESAIATGGGDAVTLPGVGGSSRTSVVTTSLIFDAHTIDCMAGVCGSLQKMVTEKDFNAANYLQSESGIFEFVRAVQTIEVYGYLYQTVIPRIKEDYMTRIHNLSIGSQEKAAMTKALEAQFEGNMATMRAKVDMAVATVLRYLPAIRNFRSIQYVDPVEPAQGRAINGGRGASGMGGAGVR